MRGRDPAEARMSLWDHLEELRWTLFKCLAALVVGMGVAFALASPIFRVLARPLDSLDPATVELVFATPMEAFMIRLKLALAAGFVLALPFMLFFVWGFLAPGLRAGEKRAAVIAALVGTVLFCLGALFGYHLLSIGLDALIQLGLSGTDARHLWRLDAYLSFCVRFVFAFGLVFELPVVVVALNWLGLVSTATLRRCRPYVIVGAFILTAILTPPDPLTQVMLAVPLLLMYEIGVVAGAILERCRRRDNAD